MSSNKRRKLSHEVNTGHDSSSPSAPVTPTGGDEIFSEGKADDEVGTKTFKDLGVIDPLCEACVALGYKAPTPIQAEAIPLALQGRDLIGLAETGSGKTAAFSLPILQALMDKPQSFHSLVLAPTRELAYQISQAIEAMGSLISVRCTVLVGGMDMIPQSISLGKKPHIIVATPGRLLDHLENTKGFNLRGLKYLVMDEADRLLDLDFGPILDKILKILPRDGRKTYLFSATMSSKVESLQRASLSNPLRVSVSTDKYQTVSTLLQSYLFFPHKHKDIYLVFLLNELAGQTTIIFTRTVNETQRIAILLRLLGFSAIPLHGQLSQNARMGALNKFRAKSRTILVATDVAARGLDIPSVDVVLNFDLPPDSKTYIHRVGRTARAGKSGNAISFVTQYDVELWLRIEAALGKKLKEYETVKDEVMVLADRVGEAQRGAVMEMKELHEARGKKGATLKGRRRAGGGGGMGTGKGKRGRDDMDREEG
ncbi:ATP-dependent rRNA helicase RRP3 [Endocarpon pusillum Z07020]|uniref:ATP-dependent rRNA helicase RRP3 n=1 Tax=Endocarpon pusillum (strain Z07020 / HMAS-L-300199) TaxID=1263415 RepID=U1GF58_ENDPU|nr:ATP-dependent rRNA helicase RRP3 [Endocarpon pusillum Z07020]ERF76267.1 ATP-dependent rRNA helicase RRP3 [Endocarpon pusillum Z07020]